MGKKKFIDKRKSATFQLLARDSSDPTYDSELTSDRVFIRVDNNPYAFDDSNPIFADAPGDDDDGDSQEFAGGNEGFGIGGSAGLPDNVRREILELGFPDDGYNYLAHLREIKNTGGGSMFYHNSKAQIDHLPQDVKAYDASRVRVSEANDDPSEKSIYNVTSNTVGVRIQKAIDQEVAALLDDSDLSRFGSDVEGLEEDFVVQANIPEEDEKFDSAEEVSEVNTTVNESNTIAPLENPPVLEIGNDNVGDKPRSRQTLDEQFDLLELQEYGTDNDDDEYNDFIAEEDESLATKLNHALKHREEDNVALDDKYKVPGDILRSNEKPTDSELLESAAVIRKCVEYAEKYENEDKETFVVVEESSDELEIWDCETIVSTYSNLDNHPGKIVAPEATRRKKLAETVSEAMGASSHVILLRGKQKLPVDFLPHSSRTAAEKVKDAASSSLRTEQPKKREHGESAEDKRERKAAVKKERREARVAKKEMKGLYKCEAQRAQKVSAFSGPSSIHIM